MDYDGVLGVEVALPPTNRGVQKTNQVQVGLDWLSATFSIDLLDWCRSVVPGEWVKADRGFLGYPECEVNGSSRIAYGVRGEVHLVLTGQSLNALRGAGASELDLAREVCEKAVSIARVDVAFDTVGLLDIDQIERDLRAGRVSTRFKQWRGVRVEKFGTSLRDPQTLYLGSAKSDSQLRIYDKGVEGGGMPAGLWVRVELQLRDANAEALLKQVAEKGSFGPAGEVLGGLVDIKAEAASVNKHRVSRAAYWDALLEGAKRGALMVARAVDSLSRSCAWLREQVAPLLSACVAGLGGDTGFLYELLDVGRKRWRLRHRALAGGV